MAIVKRFKQYGFEARTEVKFNGGYADIVTDWQGGTIIEVKQRLTHKKIYEAFGQLNLYGLKNDYKFIITGFYPNDLEEQKSAKTIASMVEQDERVKVLFIKG
ncbi:hypothetical protein LC607_17720 [Nostoc sp. CHAB 5824]|nr:hypothetical protein [Nostoc sp. CHAB 5824]